MENYFQIQNKLWVHKGINPEQYLGRPYYEFQWLIEEWHDFLQKQKEQNDEEKSKIASQQAQYDRSNTHFSAPEMPKMDMPNFSV